MINTGVCGRSSQSIIEWGEGMYIDGYENDFAIFNKWWNGEDIGRCLISISAPINDGESPPPLPEKPEDRWLDLEYIKAAADYQIRHTFFGGDAVPIWHGGYAGNDSIPAFLGCNVVLDESTGWWQPVIADGALSSHLPEKLNIKENNKWWNNSQQMHNIANECAAGKAVPSVPAIGGPGDVLSALRSNEKLLFDMIEEPETVKKFEDYLIEIWIKVYSHYYELHKEASFGGSSNFFFGLWAPGTFYIPSNDFSYMISTEMYERVFLDAMTRQINFLDYSLFHVDGIEAFRHVDMLCSIKKLTALQILPGAGKPSPLRYMDVLKKVQRAGKGLHITIPPNEVKTALETLSHKGLIVATYCETAEEADELVKFVNSYYYV